MVLELSAAFTHWVMAVPTHLSLLLEDMDQVLDDVVLFLLLLMVPMFMCCSTQSTRYLTESDQNFLMHLRWLTETMSDNPL